MKDNVYYGIAFLLCIVSACKKSNAPAPEADLPVTPPVVVVTPSLTTVKTWLTDKSATDETAALFYNMQLAAKTNILFGHQDDTKRGVVSASAQWANEQQFTGISQQRSDVKDITGAYPAVYGFDFNHIADFDSGNWFDYELETARKLTIDAYNRGGVITYCWHYANPVSKGSFYWTDSPVEAVSQVLPGGSANEIYKNSLKEIADYAKTLIGSDGKLIPVIFRPFHESDGDWFWWGKAHCTTEQYKELYQYTVTYLRDNLGVHNFLYAWSPDRNFNSEGQYLDRYPGNNFVDLVGVDNYEDMKGSSADLAASKFKIVSDYAKRNNKLAALTETGLQNLTKPDWYMQVLLKALRTQPIEFSYALVWANTKDAYWTPYKNHPAEADFIAFKNNSYLVFGDKLPQMYKLK